MKKKRDLQESKLQQLENSVEGEERKWQDKAEALTVELQQVRGQGHGPVKAGQGSNCHSIYNLHR